MNSQVPAVSTHLGQAQPEFNLVALLASFVRFRKLVMCAVFLAGVANGFLAWRSPRTYTSTASVISENRGGTASLSIPGLGGLSNDPTQSAAFYANLATSEAVLRKVIETHLSVGSVDGRERVVRVVDLMGGQGTPAKRRRSAMGAIEGMIEARVELGAIEIAIKASDPVVARDIAAAVMKAMNQVNSERRRGSASRERAFAEERMREARLALKDSEEAQARFLIGNREWQSSPSLTLAYESLLRETNRLAQMYLTRSEALELARIEEVRDLPVLSVLSDPEISSEPDPRSLGFAIGVGASVGLAAILVLITLVELFRSVSRQDSPDVVRLRTELASAIKELRRWIRPPRPFSGDGSK